MGRYEIFWRRGFDLGMRIVIDCEILVGNFNVHFACNSML